MECMYDNGMYVVLSDFYAQEYLVVNKLTNIAEDRIKALPTAKYQADALKNVTIKFNKAKSKEEAEA
ncbi:hypothetical protein PQC38_gp087 [Aeromonas phage BUCT695]|uniref:hypothetical protein n=1 Tax=Aeromonas phage BUCT695 TaxID=2908630 RepID=UPI0023290659|nr:hypothetical protein PQC38_gp087 [Aeromonas phage BUCT695]UIW10563.1 hypothetical protein [Aeromonas phage BUCT695]